VGEMTTCFSQQFPSPQYPIDTIINSYYFGCLKKKKNGSVGEGVLETTEKVWVVWGNSKIFFHATTQKCVHLEKF
jgi:hypothetical protein